MSAQIAAATSLVALLRGEDGAIDRLNELPASLVAETALREGLAPLTAERLATLGPGPAPLKAHLAGHARRDALQDLLRQPALKSLLEQFASAGVPALLFKGEHLAYLCYARPDLRPRVDSDILIRPADRPRAQQVLELAGYVAAPQLHAELISYQCAFVKQTPVGAAHVVDLHWRVCNPQQFGGVLEVEELMSAAMPIPALGGEALGPGLVHALLLSLLHPVAHHSGRDRLLWDLDSALLASRIPDGAWPEFLTLVEARGLSALCHARLVRAIELFRAPVPPFVMEALARAGADRARTISPRVPATQAGAVLASVRSLPKWSDRAALLRQHLLPPRDYMRRVYAPASRSPLAVLYMQRAILGFWKYCRRPH